MRNACTHVRQRLYEIWDEARESVVATHTRVLVQVHKGLVLEKKKIIINFRYFLSCYLAFISP